MHLLRDYCVSCHNPDKTKGDLDLTQRQTALAGGGEGPAFAEGNPGGSRLIQFLKPDSDSHMPPKKQLSDDHIATLSQWITAGAVWLPEELDVKNRLPPSKNWAICREVIDRCSHSPFRQTTNVWLPDTATR